MSTTTLRCETERLDALNQCHILDTAAEPVFDDLTALAAEICQTPIATISLVDEARQWFKSRIALAQSQTPRSIAFCAHAILTPGQPFIVEDASADPRFRDNPLVTSAPHIRFYAGIPITTSERLALGALCVIDTRPRVLSRTQIEHLQRIARQAAALLELRRVVHITREARDTAESSSRAKSAFLANVSHEIRTPLTAILGHAELLSDLNATSYDRIEGVQTIQRNGVHLLRVLNDILDLSRVEAGKVSLRLQTVTVDDLIGEVVSLLAPPAQRRGIAIVTRTEPSTPPSVRTDAVRLRQVLMNLVSNAIKFTGSGSVQIIARGMSDAASTNQGLRIDVIDSGRGIAPADLQQLFKPFSQLNPPCAGEPVGTGLGLTISRELARLMGGDIEVDSTIGSGSRFSIVMPSIGVKAPGTDAATMQPKQESLPSIQSSTPSSAPVGRVLIVDDGPDNRRLLGHFLRIAGAQVEYAENGDNCIRRLTADATVDGPLRDPLPFDVILMDVEMPVLDGLSATRTLRAKGYAAPIIALTARASAADRADCLAAGCDAFLTKPVDRHTLIQTCRQFTAALTASNSTTLAA